MKYIKLYEDFFSFFRHDKLSDKDTERLFGLTREDIELRLLDVTDEVEGIHVAINFDIDNTFLSSKEIFIRTDVRTGDFYYERVLPESMSGEKPERHIIKNIKIQIHFHLSGEKLNMIKSDKDWPLVRSKYDVTGIVDELKESVERNKIKEYFQQHGWGIKEIENSAITLVTNDINGLRVGQSIYSIFISKKLR